MSKSKKLKSEKLLKSKNSPNFDITKARSSFLTFNTKTALNYLRITFIKALIFWYFDSKCHIWIKINILVYAIDEVLSQLTFGTSSNGVITKNDLS